MASEAGRWVPAYAGMTIICFGRYLNFPEPRLFATIS